MAQLTVKQVKKGEYIQLLNSKGQPQNKVYIRGAFDRSLKKYELQNYWDINNFRYVKGSAKCIVADF